MKSSVRKIALGSIMGVWLFLNLTCAPAVRFTSATAPEGSPQDKSRNWVPIDKNKIMKSVDQFRGIPYKWGGEDKNGMDCSGLVKCVFRDLERIELPHKATEQAQYGVKVSRDALQCGDLIFFKMQGFMIDHVGIYLGDGHFVHASSITGVTVTPLDDDYYKERFALAKRLYYE